MRYAVCAPALIHALARAWAPPTLGTTDHTPIVHSSRWPCAVEGGSLLCAIANLLQCVHSGCAEDAHELSHRHNHTAVMSCKVRDALIRELGGRHDVLLSALGCGSQYLSVIVRILYAVVSAV
jgi:hypothetical protein